MPRTPPVPITRAEARRLWLSAQRLDTPAPFGAGPAATQAAVEHLGYVQIDTINVIERSHHHILYTRIPAYRREDLQQAQSADKTVFEYWTHALSYVPTRDLPIFLRSMKRDWRKRSVWFTSVTETDIRKAVRRIRREGALTIRDIDDDVLIEKDHEWASRKPTKRALQIAFFKGLLTISRRAGMLKTYELIDRHFGWVAAPRAVSERELVEYRLDRALRTQGVVSLDSICYLDLGRKPAVRRVIEARLRQRRLVSVALEGAEKLEFWAEPAALEGRAALPPAEHVHILSPFDPITHIRKRAELLFGYLHRFEAYVPKEKRVFGYFALPVLVGDAVVAAIDLKTDRERGKLLVQKWTWVGKKANRATKPRIEAALHRFENFQLARSGGSNNT